MSGEELVIVVQVQTYGEEEKVVLEKIRDVLTSVISLCDLSVGTFTVSDIRTTEER